ncbi:twin-arginine translocation signal domain-containing protein [Fodinicola feengrottensis]|uniref:twin-arginine translocation signal domain-containing protein n=1 Tax=Fodinicola feengrottensis TaxID=435914 RepID=UPI002441FC0D|nr:twin-arginine translocation signal domain-containing protein [Fodinicola feengrottensis]
MSESKDLSRRTVLGRAAALGALAVPGAALLDACATGGGGGGGSEKGTVTKDIRWASRRMPRWKW